jgi:integrase
VPTKPEGVYPDGRGGWYVKVSLGRDPLTGRREQLTRWGFRTATEAGKARRELQAQVERGAIKARPAATTVNELMDMYLDGIDADGRLSAKTRFDHRHSTDDYIRGRLGEKRVRDVTAETVLAWQRALTKGGGTKSSKPLSANSVRLARAPLAGAFKLAVSAGMVAVNPMLGAPRPRAHRSIPKHWSPEQARELLGSMEGDRTWPVWAFLLGAGLRIGELVWLRWGSVDLDAGLVDVLRRQRNLQAKEKLAAKHSESTQFVFTQPTGGSYHPQYLSKLLATYSCELGLPRRTAHGLRHTSATLMLASGVPAKVAAERIGHADATLFTNLDSHLTPTMQREAAERIGATLFRALTTQ